MKRLLLLIALLFALPLVPGAEAQEPIFLPVVHQTLPPGVYLLKDKAHYIANGQLYVVGEIYNHTSEAIRYTQVTLDVFDADENLLGTDSAYVFPYFLQSETQTCYRLSVPEPPNWSQYIISLAYYENGSPLPTLTIYGDNGKLEADGTYTVSGTVRNDGDTKANSVRPVITLVDDQGKIVDCGWIYIDGWHLWPDQSGAFVETFNRRADYSNIMSYKILVDGELTLFR